MNFSYMIILLFAIMLYIIFKTKPSPYMVMLYITILLILNEIYNYRDYNRDNFYQGSQPTQSFKVMLAGTNYNYGQGENNKGIINPQNFLHLLSLDELQQYNIPHDYDKQLEGSMSCIGKEKILDMVNQRDKLKSQSLYMNKLYNFYGRENIDLDELDSLKGEVFNPIERNESLENLKCPTTCHLIADEEVCRKALHVPVFETKLDYTNYIGEIEKCNNKKNDTCERDKSCYWDDDFQDCYYDKRRCFYKPTLNNKNPQCYTRCEFLTIPPATEMESVSDTKLRIARSKAICENASGYNTSDYDNATFHCKWNSTNNKCVTKNETCNKYMTERECSSDSNCEVDNATNECVEI